jgi:hypothetical protein
MRTLQKLRSSATPKLPHFNFHPSSSSSNQHTYSQDNIFIAGYSQVTMNLYTYTALSTPDCIRLLTLRAGKRYAVVECGLTEISLNPLIIRYEALSYTWGSDKQFKAILIDGYVAHVRENLASALHHLRREDEDRVLWIDALRINQSDISERNDQVLKMGTIFHGACSVQVWLGEAKDDSDAAMMFVKNLGMQSFCDEILKNMETSVMKDPVLWRAIALLMERPWFRRRWVIQEIAFARDVIVQCGGFRATWEELSKTVEFLQLHGREIWEIWMNNVDRKRPELIIKHGQGDLGAQGPARLIVASKASYTKMEQQISSFASIISRL